MKDLRVLLIGGPPGAGKTTLTRSVGAALGFLSTTVDDLVAIARLSTDAATRPDLHSISQVGWLQYFTERTPEQMIADATALERAMWPTLVKLIRRYEAGDVGIVLDWWLFDPDRVAEVSNRAVKSVWLHIEPEALDLRESNNTSFRQGSTDPAKMHANFMHRSLWRNQLVLERATALDLPVLHQPGDKSVGDLTDETLELLRMT